MAKLTHQQEQFCQVFIKTGNQSEAYRQAYPKSLKWKPESVNVKASDMMSNVKVSSRVKELQEQLSQRHDLSKDKILDRLKQIILEQKSIGAEKIDLGAMNKAIDTVNKMMGHYEADNKQKADLKLSVKTLDDFYL